MTVEVWPKSTYETYFTSQPVSTDARCRVRIGDGLIEVSYEDDDGSTVRYSGTEHGAGHFILQIISERYERGSIVVTTNRAFKRWPEIFNNDATLTSALLDRLLHHAEIVLIEGKSFRAKDQVEI